jgi:hypothetical protein
MPPKLREGHVTLETLPKLSALAEVLLATLDALAAKGLEADDRPRIFAATLLRWARGEADGPTLAAAAKALDNDSWRTQTAAERATPWALAAHAANALMSWRAQCMKYPTHTRQAVPQCAWRFVAVWAALGEPDDAARACVANLYAARFRAITGRDPDVSPLDPAAMQGVVRFGHMARFGN